MHLGQYLNPGDAIANLVDSGGLRTNFALPEQTLAQLRIGKQVTVQVDAWPDEVFAGKVRGGEALDLIKVWGTSHPGGIATIHAGSALGALLWLEQLILEVATNPPRALIAEAVNVVIHIAGCGRKHQIESITVLLGLPTYAIN